MRHFVTHFDINYAPQGLSLYRSIQRHVGEFTLWVVCLDDQVESLLEELALPGVRVIPLEEVETEPLIGVRTHRSRIEYIWTLTPFLPSRVFDLDESVVQVTYLDADTFLLRDPSPAFSDLASQQGAVLITEHAFDGRYDQTLTSGRFCVQFVIFNREGSSEVLTSWQQQCLDWCSAMPVDGRFGDQKYLDEWPTRFGSRVRIASNPAWFSAPWNASRFGYGEALLYHFHGLKLMSGDRLQLTTNYYLPDVLVSEVYAPYREEFRQSLRLVRSAGFSPKAIARPSAKAWVRNSLGRLRRAWNLAGGYRSMRL